jgi:hypothetical protein
MPATKHSRLTAKQEKFVRETVKNNFDPVAGAKKAYPNQVNPYCMVEENLKNPRVNARIVRMALGAGLDIDGIDLAVGVKDLAYDKDVEPKTRLDSFRTLAEMLQLIGRPALIAQQFNQAENGTLNVKDLAAAFTDEPTTTASDEPTQ